MNRFNQSLLTRLGIGYDTVLALVSQVDDKSTFDDITKLPPYNIIKVSDTEYRLDVDVPGVTKNNVVANLDPDFLTVQAKVDDVYVPGKDGQYLHKGIFAGGSFKAKFFVAKNLVFKDAVLVDGILSISFMDSNKPRIATDLPIGPFPAAAVATHYKITYNSKGEPIAIPVDNPDGAVIPLHPDVDPDSTVTVVSAPVVVPAPAPEVTPVSTDVEATSSDTPPVTDTPQTLPVTPEATAPVDVSPSAPEVPQETPVDSSSADTAPPATPSDETTNQTDLASPPESAPADVPSTTVVVNAQDQSQPTVAVNLPVDVPHVVEVTAATPVPEAIHLPSEAPALTLSVNDATHEIVSDNAAVSVVPTPAGSADIVVAVDGDLNDKLNAVGVNAAAVIATAMADHVGDIKPPEATDSVVGVQVSVPSVDVPVVVPVDVPPVVAPVVDSTTNTVVLSPVADVPADATLTPVVTHEGASDVVIATTPDSEAALANVGVTDPATTVAQAIQQADPAAPAVEEQPVASVDPSIEPAPVVSVEPPVSTDVEHPVLTETPIDPAPAVETPVVDAPAAVDPVSEAPVPVSDGLTPVSEPEVVSQPVLETPVADPTPVVDTETPLVEPPTTPVVEPSDQTEAPPTDSEPAVTSEAVVGPEAASDVVPEPVAVETPSPSDVVPPSDTTTTVVHADDPTTPTVSVTMPNPIPQVVEVKVDSVANTVDASSAEPQVNVTLTDATHEIVSDDAALSVVKTEDPAKADVVVAMPSEVAAQLSAANVDVLPAINNAVTTNPDAHPDAPEAPVVSSAATVAVNTTEAAPADTPQVQITIPNNVTPVVSVNVAPDVDVTTSNVVPLTITPTDSNVSPDAVVVPVITPEGQPDVVAAVSPEAAQAIVNTGQDVATVLSDAAVAANVSVQASSPETATEGAASPDNAPSTPSS